MEKVMGVWRKLVCVNVVVDGRPKFGVCGSILLLFISMFPLSSIQAQEFYWEQSFNHAVGASAYEACENGALKHMEGEPSYIGFVIFHFVRSNPSAYDCRLKFTQIRKSGPPQFVPWFTGIYRKGDSCGDNQRNNSAIGDCEPNEGIVERKNKGAPDDELSCGAPTKAKKNPINISVGNKFQREVDYSSIGPYAEFERFYNSIDGLWTHSYSVHLLIGPTDIVLVKSAGSQSRFSLSGNGAVAENTELGSLSKNGTGWLYVSPSREEYYFDSKGQLSRWTNSVGFTKDFAFNKTSKVWTVSDSFGRVLTFTQDEQFQPLKFSTDGLSVVYAYDKYLRLSSVSYKRNSVVKTRTYHYEDALNPKLLTGITDERGVRYASWTYDDAGRAISSEHANGAEKIIVSYNSDGSSTVVNEFGKSTIYRFETIQGIKRIVAIEGEPTANCPSSNSTFTYNERGQILTKADAKGFITTHTYNDRGLETARTEATGTPHARTTNTTWHDTLNVPLTVTEGDQVTIYTYDAQGRQVSRKKISLN